MSTGFPDGGVHEDGAVDAHDVVVKQHHALPPVLLDIILQFYAILSVIIYSTEAIVNFAAREYEAVLFAVGHDFLENIFLCHVVFAQLFYFR